MYLNNKEKFFFIIIVQKIYYDGHFVFVKKKQSVNHQNKHGLKNYSKNIWIITTKQNR